MLQTFLNWAVSFAIRWLTSSVKRTTNFCHNPKNFAFLFWLISLQQRKTPKKEENIIKVAMEKKQEHFLNFWLSFFFGSEKKSRIIQFGFFLKMRLQPFIHFMENFACFVHWQLPFWFWGVSTWVQWSIPLYKISYPFLKEVFFNGINFRVVVS